MGRGPTKDEEYRLIYNGLNKLRREVSKQGGQATYADRELKGTLHGHNFTVWYSKIGPASNGECAYYQVFTIDGDRMNKSFNDYSWRTLFDWIAVKEAGDGNGKEGDDQQARFSRADHGQDGNMDEDQIIAFFQELIDTGLAWSLQGSYGRTAIALIQSGHCHRKQK